jgi:hypothetical protein
MSDQPLVVVTAFAAFLALACAGVGFVAWLEDWRGARAIRKALRP